MTLIIMRVILVIGMMLSGVTVTSIVWGWWPQPIPVAVAAYLLFMGCLCGLLRTIGSEVTM